MDSQLKNYQQIVKQILLQHAEHKPGHGEIDSRPVFDDDRGDYLLLGVGWDITGRVHSVLLHLYIKNNKIWIEEDGTEEGVAQDLLEADIPQQDIVLGFYRPKRRALTEFAVA